MTLTEMSNSLMTMSRQMLAYADRLDRGEDVCTEVKDLHERMESMRLIRDKQLATERAAITNTTNNIHEVKEMSVMDMLKSNEYNRAYAYALRHGITPSRYDEKCKILFDALTEGGGATPGEEGGFLVPVDISNAIVEEQRACNPLKDIVTVETVATNSGWRVHDTAATTAMANVSEMGTISSTQDPAFVRVPFTLSKYAEVVSVSNELGADEVAGLFAYLAKFIARRVTLTENSLIKAQLPSTTTAITSGHEISGIKKMLNVSIDPACAVNAVILTNQSGFNALDSAEDTTGRPLVQVSVADATPRLFGLKPIVVMSDAQLPNVTSSTAPIYVGDFKAGITLFERDGVSIVSNAMGAGFLTDSTDVRYIKRMCAVKFDASAIAGATLAI